jgi:heme-degrading monooxygenase HmoA
MFARIGTFSGAPERVDDEVTRQAREQTLRILQSIPGFAGLHVFADRQTGKTIAISLWETEAAAQAWEQMRGPIVSEQLRPTGHSEQESASYELVFSSTAERTSATLGI